MIKDRQPSKVDTGWRRVAESCENGQRVNMSEFVFAEFFKVIARYANRKPSNRELMYFLFEIVNRDGDDAKTELKLNKSQVSRILNRMDDVPNRIRKYCCDERNFEEVEDLFEDFLNERFEEGREDELLDELRNLYLNDSSLKADIKDYLDDFCEHDFRTYFAKVYIEVLKRNNKMSSSPIKIYSKGSTSINVLFDDLLMIAFSKQYVRGKKIVVIPTNTTFDMIITGPDALAQHVSDATIHGKWIRKMNEKGYSEDNLRDLIHNSLLTRTGETKSDYPVGTLVTVRYADTYFYLLGLSVFDENGVAHLDMGSFQKALDSLIDFYNIHGQGYPIYLPLIGTGRSRLQMSHLESFEYIKAKIMDRIGELSGSINIVIYSKDKKEAEAIVDGLQK